MRGPAAFDAAVAEMLHPLLADRWSPSRFDRGHALDPDDLAALLAAAQWAPSANNTQPWAFATACRDDATHQALMPLLSRGNAGWVPQASAVVIALAQTAPRPEQPDDLDLTHAEYDLGQAMAHLTVEAMARGLHTRQFAGFDRLACHRALGAPEAYGVMSAIAIGRWAGADPDILPSLLAREKRERSRLPLRLFRATGSDPRPVVGNPA